MPTPVETLQAIRSAAQTNSAALASVDAQVAAHITDVTAFAVSPTRGAMLDQLRRLRAEYQEAQAAADRADALATQFLGSLGPDPGPGPDPGAIIWSTGAW